MRRPPNQQTLLSRREFIKNAGALGLASLALPAPRLFSNAWADVASSAKLFPARIDSVILLWMAGGMAHTETFDPKPHREFKPGLDQRQLLSTFPQIDTVVDTIKFSKGLEQIGQVIDRGAVIRSIVGPDLTITNHSRHQYHWHTGYVPPQNVMVPHMGAMIAKTLGARKADAPAFVHIGQNLDGRPGDLLRAFLTGGFLGTEFSPFLVEDPVNAKRSIHPAAGFSPSRLQNRYQFFKRIADANPLLREYGSDYQRESFIRSLDNAHRLADSEVAHAFDISLEPEEGARGYQGSRFGKGCLLARRLVESGVRFVEVTSEYIPFANWDTHHNGHNLTVDLKKSIDAPIAQLVLDLEQRGLLDRTLIVLASEFSRVTGNNPDKKVSHESLIINRPNQYGMHQHFIKAGSVLMFGGGVKRGLLYGKTRDEHPCDTVENPVSIEDLHATIYHLLGIPPNLAYDIEKRPFYVTKDGGAKPIMALLA